MAARSCAEEVRSESLSPPMVSHVVELKVKDEDRDEKIQKKPSVTSPLLPTSRNVQYSSLKPARKRKRSEETENQSDEPTSKSNTAKSIPRPFAPALQKRVQRAPVANKRLVSTRMTQHAVDFYLQVNLKQSFSRSELSTLTYTNDLIQDCLKATGNEEEVKYSILRRRFHQMEFYEFVTDILVVKSKLLEDNGFPAVFDNPSFPYDLRADALLLFKKWTTRRFDPDPLRGIITKKGTSKDRIFNTKSLEKDYPLKVSAKYRGAGDLVNGQWWPLQLCTIRDGAHGLAEGGIYGQDKQGAYSIILSGSGYADIDHGETIQYCGTSGEANHPTAFTERMLESVRLKHTVRVLRSAGLDVKHSIYRPVKGLRYDGLYDVTGYELLDAATSMYRFTLQRCPGQDPIRYLGEAARPTEEELAAYQKIERYLKSSD